MHSLRNSLICAASLAGVTMAQCQSSWLPQDDGLEVSGIVHAMSSWDQDGAGPNPALVVVAGDFTRVGGMTVANLALFDGLADIWYPMGGGANGAVRAAVTLANGDVVIAGDFTTVGGISAPGVARWDGSWNSLGSGIDVTGRNVAWTVTELPNADLIVAGSFQDASGVPVENVARWDGSAWHALAGGGIPGAYVSHRPPVAAVATLANGDLVAGGTFSTAGGVAVGNIARWDGASWSAMPAGFVGSVVKLLVRTNGDLIVGGHNSGPGFWRLAGSVWGSLGLDGGTAQALHETSGGELIGVHSSFGGLPGVARWTGTAWQSIASASIKHYVRALHDLPGGATGDLVIGGSFGVLDGASARSFGKRVGGIWQTTSVANYGEIRCMAAGSDGSIYCGGTFISIEGTFALRIAEWNGTSWQAVNVGVNGDVDSMAVMPNGDLIVSGLFTIAGTTPVSRFARWDGASWHAVSGNIGIATRMRVASDGRLMVNDDGLRLWDGSQWEGIPSYSVTAMAMMPNGDLVASSSSHSGIPSTGRVGRWDGAAWTSLDPNIEVQTVYDIKSLPNGDVVMVANMVGTRETLWRWDGTAWQPLGGGLDDRAKRLEVLPSGDLLVLGDFRRSRTGVACPRIARWDGVSWHPVDDVPGHTPTVMAFDPAGALFVATTVGFSSDVHRLETSCRSAAARVASGCAVGSGTNVLWSSAWAQLGAAYASTGSDLLSSGLVLNVVGFQSANLALAGSLPGGQPGCLLLARADVVDLLLATDGVADYAVAIPNSQSLIGQVLWHQMLPIELDAQGGITAIHATNALELTIGQFE